MRIESVRFQNLNSLQGNWSIDFTHPTYSQEGIFTITGPTGAGKSTILDAICLALYGRTPRLETISTSTNDIMSRLTGECFAEVTFKTTKGRYRAHWSQRRARGKADGTLQSAKHEIADVDSGKVLASRLRETKDVIEELTGMDFDRFTRSMLLAQGDFAKFLKASADERAPMLEQITGTGIYSQISQTVFERAKAEDEALQALKSAQEAIAVLSEKEKAAEEKALEEAKTQQIATKKTLNRINADITWQTQFEKAAQDKITYTQQKAKAQQALEAFAEDLSRLQWAMKAASFDDTYGKLVQLRTSVSENQKQLKNYQQEEPQQIVSVKELADAKDAQEQAVKESESDLSQLRPILSEVKTLDVKISEARNKVDATQKEKTKFENQKASDIANRKTLIADHQKDENTLLTCQTYATEHAVDQKLAEEFTVIIERMKDLQTKRKALTTKQTQWVNAKNAQTTQGKEIAAKVTQADTARNAYINAVEAYEAQRTLIAKLLGDQTQTSLQTMLEAKRKEREIAKVMRSLQDHRRDLKAGEPCPLCGALEHPYATDLVIDEDAIDCEIKSLESTLHQYAQAQEKLNKLKENKLKAQAKVQSIEASLKGLQTLLESLKQTTVQAERDFHTAQDEYRETTNNLLAELAAYKPEIKEVNLAEPKTLLTGFKARIDAWKHNTETLEVVNKRLSEYEATLALIDQKIAQVSARIDEESAKLTSQKDELAKWQNKRSELFGAQDPVKVESEYEAKLKVLKEAFASQAQEHQKACSKLENLQGQIKALCDTIQSQDAQLKAQEEEFIQSLVSEGFTDEMHFVSLRLSSGARQALLTQYEQLKTLESNAATLFKKAEETLSTLALVPHTEATLDDLLALKNTEDARMEALIRAISTSEAKLAADEKARTEFAQQTRLISAQEIEVQRWSMLRALIGSADGKKFRNFAQGITFEMVVYLANIELQKLSKRYLLTRNKDNELELEVIDNYQAGQVRSTKNLSGGESFLVSLALALGLAKMSSRNVSVESIFLDEGFGTLDEETLETALHMLSNLHQSGKLIGVISHVTVLKDRISTQISVTPEAEGKSVMVGPGCKREST